MSGANPPRVVLPLMSPRGSSVPEADTQCYESLADCSYQRQYRNF